jgi:hypothetical protein
MEDVCSVKAAGKLGRRELKQMLYAVMAAFLCFIGPTYFVAAMSELIPQIYAMSLGLTCFLLGIVFILKLVKE